jgi:hypothetical protein
MDTKLFFLISTASYHNKSVSCRLCLPQRWKYQNWRISNRFTCPGSTRYGHRHRRKAHAKKSPSRISLPVPVSHSEVKNDNINRPSPSHMYWCRGIDCHFVILLLLLLCIFKIIKKRISLYNSHQMEYDYENNVTSSKNCDQMPLETRNIYDHTFSFPLNWSLDSAFICNSGLRHLAVVPKMIRKGINPMYMADPSKPGQPTTDTGDVPDWLSEFRRKKAESSRKCRARPAGGEKKSPVPGRLRVKLCRERKARIASAKTTTGTVSNNSM